MADKEKWDALKKEIIEKLDVRAEYAALGIEFTGTRESKQGFLNCWAKGRDHGDRPNAGVCVGMTAFRGRYCDFGGGGASLSLWDFSVVYGVLPDYYAAISYYAAKAGVKLPRDKEERAIDSAEFFDATPGLLMLYTKKKPGVSVAAMLACGVRCARVPKNLPPENSNMLFVLPMYGSAGLMLDPVGWHGCPTNPAMRFRLFQGAGNEPKLLKTYNIGPCGLMGKDTLSRLTEINDVWWCEGMSDLLCCQTLIINSGRRDVGCVALPGATQPLTSEQAQLFGGKRNFIVYDVGDKDNAGRIGAKALAGALLPVSLEVRDVQLPMKDGKNDLRDWACET